MDKNFLGVCGAPGCRNDVYAHEEHGYCPGCGERPICWDCLASEKQPRAMSADYKVRCFECLQDYFRDFSILERKKQAAQNKKAARLRREREERKEQRTNQSHDHFNDAGELPLPEDE